MSEAALSQQRKEKPMSDPRINKLADMLINYSLALKPGEQLELAGSPGHTPSHWHLLTNN
jgi:hypothetical protein